MLLPDRSEQISSTCFEVAVNRLIKFPFVLFVVSKTRDIGDNITIPTSAHTRSSSDLFIITRYVYHLEGGRERTPLA